MILRALTNWLRTLTYFATHSPAFPGCPVLQFQGVRFHSDLRSETGGPLLEAKIWLYINRPRIRVTDLNLWLVDEDLVECEMLPISLYPPFLGENHPMSRIGQ